MDQYNFIKWLEANGYTLQFASMCGRADNLQKLYRYSNGQLIIQVKILKEV